MKRDSEPICNEDGRYADIQNPANDETCAMHQKRNDKKWGSWQQIQEIDNETEWKTLIRKEMILNAAHGGIKEEGDSGKVAIWFKSMRDRKTWSEARAYCQNLSGDLFSDSDWTREELDLLARKMGSEGHRVGMYTEDFTVCKTVNGQVFAYLAGPCLLMTDVMLHCFNISISTGLLKILHRIRVVLKINDLSKSAGSWIFGIQNQE